MHSTLAGRSDQEKVTGLVERITFFNEENGFCVIKVKSKTRAGLITVVGSAASINPGEWIEADGRWVQDRDHGLQFKADSIRTSPPSTADGIKRYLGSGLIKGIGPVLAERLVAEFGSRVFSIIEEAPRALERVEGIGPTKRERIKEAWEEARHIHEIMVFLHSHGVSTSRAVRIHKTYGDRAIEILMEDPYALARDIHGIGFKSADQIAQRLGIPADSVKRASAGLSHVLLQATDEGHCGLPEQMLKEEAVKLLQVPESVVVEALTEQTRDNRILVEQIDGERIAFLPHLQAAEREIASRLARLVSAGASRYPPVDFQKAVDWCREKTGTELAPSQLGALKVVLNSRAAVITGGPGVGKTTLVQTILMILTAKKLRCLLCAPTGRAAKRLSEATGHEAKTIHRLLEAQPSGRFGRTERNPLECDLLIVDEVSMVDVPLMAMLLRACPPGCAIVLVGDVDQLPSVGPGMVLRDVIESGIVPVVRLTEVFRQAAGSDIIRSAHAIRQGIFKIPDKADRTADFLFLDRQEPEAILATLSELVQKRIPSHLGLDPVRDVQLLCPMNRGLLGVRELNARLQALLNPRRPGEVTVDRFGFRFGKRDKVIQLENNYDKDVFNGDIGFVERIDPVQHELTINFEGRPVTYDFDEVDQLALAYAITIHKSQGSEFPAVVIPMAMEQYILLQRNLIYTGITRGRRLVVVVGQKKALGLAVRNSRVTRRYSGLLQRLKNAR
ncbi:MAG: ATP-dependent RecD-like DNA helicase [Acidobacteriota bacterium]